MSVTLVWFLLKTSPWSLTHSHSVHKHNFRAPTPTPDLTFFSKSPLDERALAAELHVPTGQSPQPPSIDHSVPRKSLRHTYSVMVPSQPLPRALRGQSPSCLLLRGRRPLTSSHRWVSPPGCHCFSVTVAPQSLLRISLLSLTCSSVTTPSRAQPAFVHTSKHYPGVPYRSSPGLGYRPIPSWRRVTD